MLIEQIYTLSILISHYPNILLIFHYSNILLFYYWTPLHGPETTDKNDKSLTVNFRTLSPNLAPIFVL